MRKLVLSGIMAIAVIAGVNAQKVGYDPVNAPFGHGEDSVQCRINLSLMQTSAKAEAYADALEPWNDVYENCPRQAKTHLSTNSRIFKALYESETDVGKKQEYIETVKDIYDKRLIYFGDDDAKGTILA